MIAYLTFILKINGKKSHIYLELRKSEDDIKVKEEKSTGRQKRIKNDLVSQLEKLLTYFAFSIHLLQFKDTVSFSPNTTALKIVLYKQTITVKPSTYLMR